MTTVYDVNARNLLTRLTEDLKEVKELTPPDWSRYVKTGVCKERPPVQEDWWYMRAASLLRRLYLDGPVGVERYGDIMVERKTAVTNQNNFIRLADPSSVPY